jgi:hypothetical protein
MAQIDRWSSSHTQAFRARMSFTEDSEAKGFRSEAILERLNDKYHRQIATGFRGPVNNTNYRLPEATAPATLIYPPSAMVLADEVTK